MRSFSSFVVVFVCVAIAFGFSAYATQNFDASEYLGHIEYLASDELGGRMSGEPGQKLAAEYIVQWYEDLGILPGNGDSYLQSFEFTSGVEPGDGNEFMWGMKGMMESLTMAEDFVPVFFSPNTEVEGSLIFAGYGITAVEDEGYDDYSGIDVEGKIVIVFRHEPQIEDEEHFNGKRPSAYSDLRYKTYNAKRHGAIGMLLVTGPLDERADGKDELMRLGKGDVYGESAIPIVHVKRDVINEAMSVLGADLEEMQRTMDEDLTPVTVDMSAVFARIKIDLIKQYTGTENIIAILPGSEFTEQYIIIGAHYDHLGLGQTGSMLTREEYEALSPDELIHHGADDNASGTAGVLELAKYFAETGGNRHTLVFMNFSAEELGTLGSLYYVKNPVFPLDRTMAMINMDMIGRVQNNVITIQGIGTAEEWPSVIDEIGEQTDLTLKRFDDGVGGSDYTSFYNVGVPVLNFFSGVHMDYHRPSDTTDKINSEDAARVLDIVNDIVVVLDRRDDALTFQKTTLPEVATGGQVDSGTGIRAYLGSVPDFSYSGSEGVMFAGVRKGSPADKAGLMAGDLLFKLGDADITNLYDLTYALQDYKAGDVVIAVVIRDGEEMEFEVTLGSR
ncbi:M20/M25/M40 family metallo-hydrolase [bacterium]|nr:M20/M25/M40 family metallo-hydrolase [bacterium]